MEDGGGERELPAFALLEEQVIPAEERERGDGDAVAFAQDHVVVNAHEHRHVGLAQVDVLDHAHLHAAVHHAVSVLEPAHVREHDLHRHLRMADKDVDA